MKQPIGTIFKHSSDRNTWLSYEDDRLLKDCDCDTFKATGKGGQKRNKTSSAIRLTHLLSGIAVTASDSRIQQENKRHALKKLRFKLALHLRDNIVKVQNDMSPRNPNYHLWVAMIFDILYKYELDIKSSAEELELSSSKLLKLIARDTFLWQELSSIRKKLHLHTLKVPK